MSSSWTKVPISCLVKLLWYSFFTYYFHSFRFQFEIYSFIQLVLTNFVKVLDKIQYSWLQFDQSQCNKALQIFLTMRLFRPLNSLVVSRNLWLILLHKIWYFSSLVKYISKNFYNSTDFKSVLIFSLALVVAELLTILWLFAK